MTMYLSRLMTMGQTSRLKAREKVMPHQHIHIAGMAYIDSTVFIDLVGSEVILGKGVELSDGVRILTHSHEFNNPNWRDLDEVVTERPTVIEDYAFIGINAIICPGCKNIGRHSVIGAGAVVTRDVPEYEIWAGNPAKKTGEVDRS